MVDSRISSEEPNVFFRSLYHNGIVERDTEYTLGPSETDEGVEYLLRSFAQRKNWINS